MKLSGNILEYNRMDRRLRKTEEAVQNALIELVTKEGYENLKMIDVINKADINKSTFYLHYQSLLGVSFAIEDRLIAELLDILHEDYDDSETRLDSVLTLVKNSRKAYQTVLSISEGHFYKKLEINMDPFLPSFSTSKAERELSKYKKAALFGSLFGAIRSYVYGNNRSDQKKILDVLLEILDLSSK